MIRITENQLEKYRIQHKKEVEAQKSFLDSNDNIKRAYAKSIVYGIHDPLLYAIRDTYFFHQEYSGIDYVLSVFADYGYTTEEFCDDGIHRINILKNNMICAKLSFSDENERISFFNIR